MKFAVWLRAVIDALMRTPYVRMLEAAFLEHAGELKESVEWSIRLQRESLAREAQTRQDAELQLQQLRVDLTERIRDKDAVISDLRVRLAVAETDVVREQLAKQPRPAKPVPAFEGPVSFQDELAQMDLKAEETEQ